MRLRTALLYLCIGTMIGIFLHELGHHLLGVPSLMSLSRNWPLVAATAANRQAAVVGTLAGPAINLLMGYGGLAWHRFAAGRTAKTAGLFLGLSGLFLALSGALINLVVDWLSGSWGNDLEQVSRLLGWNMLILPAIVVALALPGFAALYRQWLPDRRRWAAGGLVLFGAWLLAGLVLMGMDQALQIRFALR